MCWFWSWLQNCILCRPGRLCRVKTGTSFTAKNTCLRLYLAWLDHNCNAKIVGPAPVQWMGSAISLYHRRPAAKIRNKACVNHEPQCVKASPAPRSSSLVKIRTLTEKYAPRDWSAVNYCSQGLRRKFLIFWLLSAPVKTASSHILLTVKVCLTWLVTGFPPNIHFLTTFIYRHKRLTTMVD